MVAITIERCRAEYLLVEVDDDDSRTPKNDDVGQKDDPVGVPNNDEIRKQEIGPACAEDWTLSVADA